MTKILVTLTILLIIGCSTASNQISTEAYGKTFTHTTKNGKPYDGQVVTMAASDYYWVTEYTKGKFVVQKHYFYDKENNTTKFSFLKKSHNGPVENLQNPPKN